MLHMSVYSMHADARLCYAGDTKSSEGKQPLSVEQYRALARAFHADAIAANGHLEGAFANLFFVLMWNLMCRASNCVHILLQHLEWRGDAIAIYFSQQKTDQTGDKAKYPRHVYANPFMPEICPFISLGVYLLTFNFTGVNNNTKLFPGTNQYNR
jgi:hypothetical protein